MIRNISLYDLIPSASRASTWNNFVPAINDEVSEFLTNLQNQKAELQTMLFQYRDGIGDIENEESYIKYLQYPNKKIQSISDSIVELGDSNDDKMTKIIRWVLDNIDYEYDTINYGKMEYWALPTETIGRSSGDCEDMAFLIHSLGLHAGVPYDRLRTYGGFVWVDEERLELGGHGWTVYKRETDDEWVVLDGSYYTTDIPVEERIPMKDDKRYYDDFFYVDAMHTIDATFVNRVRDPEGRGRSISTGYFVNIYA